MQKVVTVLVGDLAQTQGWFPAEHSVYLTGSYLSLRNREKATALGDLAGSLFSGRAAHSL